MRRARRRWTAPPRPACPAEIRIGGDHEFYDFAAKYLPEEHTELDVPADLPGRRRRPSCGSMAARAFEAVGCEGLARVDFFVMPDGSLVVNEINTMPGFTPTSMYPRMWAATGVDYPALVDRLIRLACRATPACADVPRRPHRATGESCGPRDDWSVAGLTSRVLLHHRRQLDHGGGDALGAVRRRARSPAAPAGSPPVEITTSADWSSCTWPSGTNQPTPLASMHARTCGRSPSGTPTPHCSDDRRVAPGAAERRRRLGLAARWPASVVGQGVHEPLAGGLVGGASAAGSGC